ncbi:MAG TPA: serine hydrolase [Haliscomenobacter sp.]|uniref:serine hydrolase n=1 Tax=Haliscomenobacter sp. TaxID=2717303 RepID=UPI002BCC7732|nr:serine hydrolase [Haliscomenobacter sp.]HOY20895.1 serine hydrolase [Haliscomenobacter sp.]
MAILKFTALHVLAFFFFCPGISAQELSKKQKGAIEKIDTYLSGAFPGNEPGAIVLVSIKGNVAYKKAFGVADVGTKKALIVEDIMPIASMTKQFTAVSILLLAEQHKLSITDSIQKYIPEFPSQKFTITIEHLLAQTSGIREYFDIDESEYDLLTKEYSPLEIINLFKKYPLEFEPNSQFRYSNSNYFLLGLIIERVSGKKYGAFLKENIFEPLGLHQSAYWYNHESTNQEVPSGYMTKNGALKPAIPVHGSIWYSSGGITSTVSDLYKWQRSIFTGKFLNSNKPLTKSAVLTNGQNTGYSFGFFIKTLQGSPTIQHGGNLYGFTSSGIFLPNEEIYVFILSNKGFAPTEEIANYITSELLDKPIKQPSMIRLDYNQLSKYTGKYELVSDKKRTMDIFIVGDRLVLSFPEQKGAEVDILPVENDKFEAIKVNAQLAFVKDANGKIKGVVVKQKGKSEWIKVVD